MTIVLNGTTGITNDGGYTGDGVSFADTTPTNTLVTTTGGNVGIGTSSPSWDVQVQKTGNAFLALTAGASSTAGVLFGDTSNNVIGRVEYNNGVDAMSFYTNGSETMRIDSSGNLLIGHTSSGTGVDGISLRASGNPSNPIVFLNSSGNTAGYINVNNTTTTYITSSDYRLKENIAPMTGALSKVQQLNPVTYKWKADGSDGQGFIAHELQAIVPDCVVGEKDGTKLIDIKDEQGNVTGQEEVPVYQGIDTSFLVATLTAAIQEQQAIITDLKSRIETLEAK
jgi:hypothetical protein